MQNSDLPPPQEDMAKWEAQFNQIMNSQRDGDEVAGDLGDFSSQLWSQEAGTYDFSDEPKVEFDSEGLPIMGSYTFGMCVFLCTVDASSSRALRLREREQIP